MPKFTKPRPKFRLKTKHIAVTWSDACELKPPLTKLQEIASHFDADTYVVSAEQHKNEKWHVHAYLGYEQTFETENCRTWDYDIGEGIIHPNAKPCKKNAVQGWINYCFKDGYEVHKDCKHVDLESYKGFRNRLGDKRAFEEHKLRESMQDIEWPLTVLGVQIPKPDPAIKKRHWIFVGVPSLGKTRALQLACKGRKTYWPSRDAQYRWETYEREELVVLDDFLIPDAEMIEVTETHEVIRKCSGGSRYMTHNWPLEVCRTVIIVLNDYPSLSKAMEARFNIKELY